MAAGALEWLSDRSLSGIAPESAGAGDAVRCARPARRRLRAQPQRKV